MAEQKNDSKQINDDVRQATLAIASSAPAVDWPIRSSPGWGDERDGHGMSFPTTASRKGNRRELSLAVKWWFVCLFVGDVKLPARSQQQFSSPSFVYRSLMDAILVPVPNWLLFQQFIYLLFFCIVWIGPIWFSIHFYSFNPISIWH